MHINSVELLLTLSIIKETNTITNLSFEALLLIDRCGTNHNITIALRTKIGTKLACKSRFLLRIV